jgi:hypothetical protein
MKRFRVVFLRACILFFIAALYSCNREKCGLIRQDSFSLDGEYKLFSYVHICEDMIQEDTIQNSDNRWTVGTELEEMGIGYVFESDTIQFSLPKNFRIVKVRQSFKLVPSVWSKMEDEVGQFIAFENFGALCSYENADGLNDNKLANPLDINDSLAMELYFKHNKVISKKDLISEIENMPNWDSNKEKETFKSYLNNYSSWSKAPREQFELIAGERLLTLYIQVGDDIKDLTFVYSPVYGN